MKQPPPIPAPAKFIRVTANDAKALTKFIVDLKAALAESRDTAGAYSAFLLVNNGQKLQVEVHLADARKET
jgi:hypothetical protein